MIEIFNLFVVIDYVVGVYFTPFNHSENVAFNLARMS
jgi:hypothetical protein